MKRAIIFDLGNTLVQYFTREEWPDILDQAISGVADYLRRRGLWKIPSGGLAERVNAERTEPSDHRVKPLEGRLARIFNLTPDDLADGVEMDICREFMKPAFATARVYDDTLPTLAALRQRGLRTGILSNTPWGSPAELWREEVNRHGLTNAVDAVMFCRDVGHRKPAPQGFEAMMQTLGVSADKCLFVGDDPRWDLLGPQNIGMDALLINRTGTRAAGDESAICNLSELLDRLLTNGTAS